MTASHESGFFRQESAINLASFNVRGFKSTTTLLEITVKLTLIYRKKLRCRPVKWKYGTPAVKHVRPLSAKNKTTMAEFLRMREH